MQVFATLESPFPGRQARTFHPRKVEATWPGNTNLTPVHILKGEIRGEWITRWLTWPSRMDEMFRAEELIYQDDVYKAHAVE